MLTANPNGGSGKAGAASFFQQVVALPNPLNPREVVVQPIPGTGISMRDYFAAKALATCATSWDGGEPASARDVAEWCYRVADAMMAARETKSPEKKGFPYTDGEH